MFMGWFSMENTKGFTLIELMVTLSVAAILIAVAVPSFGSLLSSNRISSSVSAFNQTLNLARSEAVRRGTVVSVCRSNDQMTCTDTPWDRGWLVWVDSNGNRVLDNAEVTIRVQGALSTVISMVQAPATIPFSYNPNGFLNIAPGNAITFEVCDSARTGETGRQIRVPAVGKNSSNNLNCA